MTWIQNKRGEPCIRPGGIDPRTADSGLNPEQLLTLAEEAPEEETDPEETDPEETDPGPPRGLAFDRGMARLSTTDREVIQACVLDGVLQREFAILVGISQCGVSCRLATAKRRLRWFAVGPGSWFTPVELKDALEGHVIPEVGAWLCIYWLTGNASYTNYTLGFSPPNGHKQLLNVFRMLALKVLEVPALQRYYDGLAELAKSRMQLVFSASQMGRGWQRGKARGPISEEARIKMSVSRTGVKPNSWLCKPPKKKQRTKRKHTTRTPMTTAYSAERAALGLERISIFGFELRNARLIREARARKSIQR